MKFSQAIQKLVDRAERAIGKASEKRTTKKVARKAGRQAAWQVEHPKPKRMTKKRPIAKAARKPSRAGSAAKSKRRTVAPSSQRRSAAHVMYDVIGYRVRWEPLGGRKRYGMFVHDRHGNSAGSAIVEPDRNRPEMFYWVVETEDDRVKAEGTDSNLRAAKERAHAAFMRHFRRYLK